MDGGVLCSWGRWRRRRERPVTAAIAVATIGERKSWEDGSENECSLHSECGFRCLRRDATVEGVDWIVSFENSISDVPYGDAHAIWKSFLDDCKL